MLDCARIIIDRKTMRARNRCFSLRHRRALARRVEDVVKENMIRVCAVEQKRLTACVSGVLCVCVKYS